MTMIPKEYPPTMTQSVQPPFGSVGDSVTDYNQSTAQTSTAYQYNWCPHKLPCGWCSYMSRPCVKGDLGSPTITWTSATGTDGTVNAPVMDGTTTGTIGGQVTGAVHGGEV